ncbi:carbon-nitrogen hydrolase family protein [Nitratifractor sp.]
MKTLHVAALQLPTLGMNATRPEFYLQNATERGAKLILMGEYVLNHFFRELVTMPRSMVKDQSLRHLKLLKRLAKEYDVTFVAPLVRVKKKRFYKTIVRVAPDEVEYYLQQILIPYEHWNEEEFFANPIEELREPMIFTLEGFRIAVMGGYELHFDPFWEMVERRKVDLVLLPSASTFGSHNRWREIIKTRAFLHGVYILRANRLGEYSDGEVKWRFYGDSMLVAPSGEVEMMLEDKESMLLEPIVKKEIKRHRKTWRFREALKKRGAL